MMIGNTRFVVLFFCLLLLVGPVWADDCPPADLNNDCVVDVEDLVVFANMWLERDSGQPLGKADLNGDGAVDLEDFAVLSGYWLEGKPDIPLKINELMADNKSSLQDEHQQYDDWLEIYNSGNVSLDIGGMYLTDDLSDPKKWKIPDDNPAVTTIAAHGFLIIWADGDTDQGPLHAGFKLSANGEELGLCTRSGILIDSILFGPQAEDESFGRFPDGSLHLQNFAYPTPGKSNDNSSPGIVINEIMYHPYHLERTPEPTGQEYIELFNFGSRAQDISNWQLSKGVQFEFPVGTVIGAGQYLVIVADPCAFQQKYPDITNWVGPWQGRLNNHGEKITLKNDVGTIIDSVRYSDEGDWSVRREGPLDHGHRGWVWSDEHDGGGKSLELINPALPNEYGQNWAASVVDNGTPGEENSIRRGGQINSRPLATDGVTWKYCDQGSDPGPDWNKLSYDDSDWLAGPSRLGYGGDGEVTTIDYGGDSFNKYISYYFRYKFDVTDLNNITGLTLRLLRDDGAVVYLNGQEIARSNMPAGEVTYQTLAVNNVYGAEENQWFEFSVDPALLQEGTNLIAAEVHQAFPSSGDLSFNLTLTALEQQPVNPDNPDIPPMILDVQHAPLVPHSDEPVSVTARILDETGRDMTVALYYRIDNSGADFSELEMLDDGMHDDGDPNDGIYGALLPPQADKTIVEFYLAATDETGHNRTWPAPSLVGALPQQVTNLLYMVDDAFDVGDAWPAGRQPLSYIIMTEAERAELADIGDGGGGEEQSNAQMNATFISFDGTGSACRYNVGVRNRGHGSRNEPPNNYRVNFRDDRPWKDVTAINLNTKYTWIQLAGSVVFRLADLPQYKATAVQVLVNGVNLALTDNGRTYGSYVLNEVVDRDFVRHHFPEMADADVYKCMRIQSPGANLSYRGSSPDSYRMNYFKQTNVSADDWSGLIDLTNVLSNATDEEYLAELNRVADVDEWLRFFAVNTILDNSETTLANGDGDDYYLLRGRGQSRFLLMQHDLDSLFGTGDTHGSVTSSIFRMIERGRTPVLERFIKNPAITPRYYAQLKQLIETVMSTEQLDPLLDDLLGGFVPASRIDSMKDFVRQRSAYILTQIPSELTIETNLPQQSGYYLTNVPMAALSGSAEGIHTRSVMVGGVPADWSPFTGKWQIGTSSGSSSNVVIVPRGAVWKYLDDGSDQGSAWRQAAYDDSNWNQGPAKLGYGGDGEVTTVSYGPSSSNKYITTYFRYKFTLEDPTQYTGLTLQLLRDDGAVIYLNGQEVVRSNMPAGDIAYTTRASSGVGGSNENSFFSFNVDPVLLQTGENILAVEIHQDSPGSSDIGFNLELDAIAGNVDTTSGITLYPGINRIVVRTFDEPNGMGNELERDYIDIWYDDPAGTPGTISGTLQADTVLDSLSGPWLVTGDITVPAGITLTIEPGTSLFFAANTGITVHGRLVAEGTAAAHIRMCPRPGVATRWDGIDFTDTSEDNLLRYVDMEFGDGQGESVKIDNSRLLIDNLTWTSSGDATRILDITHPQLIVRNSILPSISNTEPVHGTGLSGAEYLVFEGNTFGSTTGYNDIVDFTGGQRPGPIIQFYNNLFLGGGDDALDMDGTDAHIEGNIFMNFHKGNPTASTSNAIATGRSGFSSYLTVVRNIFFDNDHAVLLKEGCFLYAANNVFVRSNIAAINFGEPQRGVSPGKGALLLGNIFRDNNAVFENLCNPDGGYGPEYLRIYNNIIPLPVTDDCGILVSAGNLDADPCFADYGANDFGLLACSPALGAGPGGMDMGAAVPAGVSITGAPLDQTDRTEVTLQITGPGIWAYKYRYSDNHSWSDWSSEILLPEDPYDASDPQAGNQFIRLDNLQAGHTYQVEVIGKNSAGIWQTFSKAAHSGSWTVVDQPGGRLQLNEILARNTSFDHEETLPDMIELYNAGSGALDIGGFALSNDSSVWNMFVFPAGTVLAPRQYLVVYADKNINTSGLHTGFGLDKDGDALYLYNSEGILLDSVEFGRQVADLSLGRLADSRNWHLAIPTFGEANVVQQLGCTTNLKINEWLAEGDVLLPDGFIELYNPQFRPVSLAGMRLTDNAVGQPDKYEFGPLSFIAGHAFAAFTTDGGAAKGHLPFVLSPDQGIITLYDSRGRMVDRVYYGPQATDISQGRFPDGDDSMSFFRLPTPDLANSPGDNPPPATTELINSKSNVYYLVPHDDAGENDWMQMDWTDLTGWQQVAVNSLHLASTPGFTAYNDCVYSSGEQYIAPHVTTYGIGDRYDGLTSGPLLDYNTGNETGITVSLTQSGGVTWQSHTTSGGSDCAVGTDAYNTFGQIADMTGVIYYGSSGWWVDITFSGLDPGREYTFAASSNRGRYSNRYTIYTLTGADTYTNASTSGVDILADNQVRFNTGDNFDAGYVVRWTGITAADGSFTVRAEADPASDSGYKAYSFDVFMLQGDDGGSDLRDSMLGQNTSLWTRIEFYLDQDTSAYQKLLLRMKYDDGFVVWLNGTEIARSNFTGLPHWNSAADGNRPDEQGQAYQDFDLSSYLNLLQAGRNVLAIQGMNDQADNENFLLMPYLEITRKASASPLDNLLELVDNLRITEIMYNPTDGGNYEFIELKNIGSRALDLAGVRFTDGVGFVFPALTLDPGEYIVVAKDIAAFQSLYGTDIPVVGPYSDNLSNSGETVVLTLPAPYTAAIMRFRYSDQWYASTDGQGFSLTITDENKNPAAWSEASSWMAGSNPGGSPGSQD